MAKYALLTRGRAGFREHAAHAEGSDTTPVSLTRNLLLFGREGRGINRPAAAGIKRKMRARDTRPGVLWQRETQLTGTDTSPSQPYQFYPPLKSLCATLGAMAASPHPGQASALFAPPFTPAAGG